MLENIKSLIKTTFIRNFIKQQIDYSTWIFSSSYNTKFNYNSKYLFQYVLKNEKNITPIFVINDDELRSKLKRIYGEQYFIETKSYEGIKKVLNSGVWFTSAGLPVYGLSLNKVRIIVNLWHGVPLKKIALMENKVNVFKKVYFKYIFSENYTHILTTSKQIVGIMKESFKVTSKKIKVWGQPRNDAIYQENKQREIIKALYPDIPQYENIILYAPTYREDEGTVFFPFFDYDPNELNSYLEENNLIIFIRCHQSEVKNINIDLGNRLKLINDDKIDDIMDIINIFDLLITDYSSIYIDFLLTEKPIIFLPYDKEKYIKQRGLNFEYDSVTPGPHPDSFNDFKNEILKLINKKDYYMEERQLTNLFFNDIRKKCSSEICKSIKAETEKLGRKKQ